MNWKALRDGQCPKCDTELTPDQKGGMSRCGGCGFKITKEKLHQILNDMESIDRSEQANQQALSDL